MASDPFNAVGGVTVGIPAVNVIDANGNIVSNFLNLSGNVSAGNIYASNYKFANGSPFISPAGGSNTQLQFNSAGTLAGIPNVTWNGSKLNLGTVTALKIGGGVNGYFLQTDGSGNLNWAQGGGGNGGNGTPGGSNTQVQFNDDNAFGADIDFTYDKVTKELSVPVANISGNIILGNSTITTTITWTSAITTATTANQTIYTAPVAGITGVEFLVKGIDSTGSKYSVATVQAVTDGTDVDYATFATVNLGGTTGLLAVNIDGSNINLDVTPSSSNSTVWTTQVRLI